jgi:mRNA interferase HigB
MKIHLIRRETVNAYQKQNAQCRVSFDEWLVKLKYADWAIPEDIQSTFPSADLLGKGGNRVVFDIGGNKYRLIAKYAFGDIQVHLFIS